MRIQMMAAVPWRSMRRRLVRRLSIRGFSVRDTFNLQVARASLPADRGAICPEHGRGACECQYLVLQVSRIGESASVVVLQGYGPSTKVALSSPPGEGLDEEMMMAVCEAVRSGPGEPGAHPGRHPREGARGVVSSRLSSGGTRRGLQEVK